VRWRDLLRELQTCAGDAVFVSDGKSTEPAAAIRTRPSARGVDLCLFSGETAISRIDLVAALEKLSQAPGRRFASSARGTIGGAALPVERVSDESADGVTNVLVILGRPAANFNHRFQTGDSTTLRTKRIKNGN
jgi:hypothetical protein